MNGCGRPRQSIIDCGAVKAFLYRRNETIAAAPHSVDDLLCAPAIANSFARFPETALQRIGADELLRPHMCEQLCLGTTRARCYGR
jgi:hypothetical protein